MARNRRMVERARRRHVLDEPAGLDARTVQVGGVLRTVWFAPSPPDTGAPLLIALHGAGGQGPGMAALTGLHRRGPQAGFLTVFPDGVNRVWNDTRDGHALRSRRGVDDVAFVQELVRLFASSNSRPPAVFLTGISNGALLAEHVARHALVPVAGLGLVAGPGTEMSHAVRPAPAQAATVVIFAGTEDPLVPYRGGPIGLRGRLTNRRDRMGGGRGLAVAAETSAAEWAAADGLPDAPAVERLPNRSDLPVTRLRWSGPDRPSVTLYRVEGGGHSWPGGAPALPARIVGPIARDLDATGLLLDEFRDAGLTRRVV